MLVLRPVDRFGDVVHLAFAGVVRAAARARAAKVEAQRCDVRVLESARRAKDDLVVQRAAAEGMGMTDDGEVVRILQIAIQRFEPTGARIEIDVAERLRVHRRLVLGSRSGASRMRMRSSWTFSSCVTIEISRLPSQMPV